ncbi:MAG TPA: hypothetical protein VLE02_01005 [Nitrosarchaeum sp.]|nr:hypothetical protein [Nitrosarchaeum sp.]
MSEKRETLAPIMLTSENFDGKKFIVRDAKVNVKKGGVATWTSSPVYYEDDDGKACHAYIDLPEQSCFSLTYKHGFDSDPSPENRTGIQLGYPLTSRDTKNKPTKEEKFTLSVLQQLFKLAVNAVKEEKKKGEKSEVMQLRHMDVSGKEEKFVKPLETKGKKPEDSDKIYPSLLSFGKGEDMKVSCLIFDENGANLDVHAYTVTYDPKAPKTTGFSPIYKMKPCLKVTGLYWGKHGDKNPYIVSVTLKVARIIIKETEFGNQGPPKEFFLPPPIKNGEDGFSNKEDDPFKTPKSKKEKIEEPKQPISKKKSKAAADSEEEDEKPISKKKSKVTSDSDDEDKPKKILEKLKQKKIKKTKKPKKEDSDEE